MGGTNDNDIGLGPGIPVVQPGFTPLFTAPSPAELNLRLPQFEILGLLGQGGMGAVYKARQPRLDRFVAIKLLPPLLDGDLHSFGERFEREARAMAQLNHPNIVTVHDFGETEDGLRYIVMEYVDGTDLHAAISSKKVTPAHVLSWAPQICAGLSYAHGQNIVHRDIKPANILISKEGIVKVGDFGLAKLMGNNRDLSLTQSQVSMGTPDYAAPEAMRAGADVDQRADIYSFGVLLYEMLTGIVPRGAWKAPSVLVPIDSRLDKIVIKAMQPNADHRYQRMSQIAEAFEDLKRSPEPPAPTEIAVRAVPVTPAQTKKKMHPGWVAFIALGSVAAVVGGILLLASEYMRSGQIFGYPVSASNGPGLSGTSSAGSGEVRSNEDSTRQPQPGERTVPGRAIPVREVQEKHRPPDLKDGWVSLEPVNGNDPEQVGSGWSATLDGLAFNGKGKGGSRLMLTPPPPPLNYEFRLEVVAGGLVHPLTIRLPLEAGAGVAYAVFGAPAGEGNERFAGLVLAASPDPGNPGNRSRHQLSDPKAASCRVVIRVVKKEANIGIEATLNGAVAISWVGTIQELGASDLFRSSGKRDIGLAATHPVTLHGVGCRALPAGTWLVHDESLPSPMDLLTGISLNSMVNPLPASVSPPPPETPLSKLQQRLTDLRTRFEGVENDVARVEYERSMANLRESYQAALNRTVRESAPGTLPLTVVVAVQRELLRVRDKEPIEDSDPPELPETVRQMREVFRSQSKANEADLRLATAPILREHLAALQALAAEAELPATGLPLVKAETARVEARLRENLAATAANGTATSAAPMGASSGTPSAPASLSSPPPLNLARLPFPPTRQQIKGTVIVEPRTKDDAAPAEVLQVPSGLSGNVVDIVVGETTVGALKSNGRVALWGTSVTNAIQEEIQTVDRVCRISLAQRATFGQVALLLEDGSVKTKALGAAASGILEVGKESTRTFKNLVDVAVTPVGGVALDRDGKLLPWGVFASFPGMPENVMQVRQAGVGIVALGANGVPAYLTASGLPPGVPSGQAVAEIQFGSQETPGAVVRSPDGKITLSGSFAAFAKDLESITKTSVVKRFEAGEDGVAIQTEGNSWYLLGTGFRPGPAKSFEGCVKVIIAKNFVAGLLPN